MLSHRGVRKYVLFVSLVLGCFFAQTESAFAQAYVPVIDINMQTLFPQYTQDLFQRWDDTFGGPGAPSGTGDTLRDIITGSNPGGIAQAPCANGNNLGQGLANEPNQQDLPAFAYTDGPWKKAADAVQPANALPTGVPVGADQNGPYVQVNYSHSLRCLLEDIAEYQKLGISVQIHSLLKAYIADAQTKQLNNQLMNKIAAANLDWAKAGNQVNDNGVLSNEPVYNVNPSQSNYNTNARQLEHITDQAAADPASGNPVGSLGICEPWRLDTAADMVRNNRTGVEDPFNYTEESTGCKLDAVIDPNDYSKFSDSFNDPANKQGGILTFMNTTANPEDTPLGASTLADRAASQRIARQEEVTKQKNSNTGFRPTSACSGNPDDPYCLDQQFSTDISPSGQNQQTVQDMAKEGNDQIQAGNTLDAQGGPEAEVQSTDLNTKSGVYGYDSTPIATSKTAVNVLVKEFYDAINFGYFGIHQSTTQWAQGTMLMIYDEMKFDDTNPNTIYTNKHDPVDSGY